MQHRRIKSEKRRKRKSRCRLLANVDGNEGRTVVALSLDPVATRRNGRDINLNKKTTLAHNSDMCVFPSIVYTFPFSVSIELILSAFFC